MLLLATASRNRQVFDGEREGGRGGRERERESSVDLGKTLGLLASRGSTHAARNKFRHTKPHILMRTASSTIDVRQTKSQTRSF